MIGKGGSGLFIYQSNIYVVGGANREQQDQFDIWQIDQDNNQKQIAKNLGMITGQSQILYKNHIYVTGGQNFLTGEHFPQFYKINLDNFEIEFQKGKINFNRNSHSMLLFKDQILIYGGANQKGPLNDLWIFDINENKWTQQKYQEVDKEFKPREMHTSHIYQSNKKLKCFIKEEKSLTEQFQNKKMIELDFGVGKQQDNEVITKISKLDITEGIEIQNEQENENQEIQQKQDSYDYMIIIGGRFMSEILDEIQVIDLNNYITFSIFKLPFLICAHTSILIKDCIYIIGGTDETQFFSNMFFFLFKDGFLTLLIFSYFNVNQKMNYNNNLNKEQLHLLFMMKIKIKLQFLEEVFIQIKGTYEKEENDFIKVDLKKYNTKQGSKMI